MGQPRRPDQQFTPPAAATPPSPSSGVFFGRRVVIFGNNPGNGLFVYNPRPGAGNLIYSVTAPGTTTDGLGNTVLPVATMYGSTPAGGTAPSKIQMTSSGGVLLQQFYTGTASESAPGQLKIGAVNIGTPNEQQQFIMGGAVNSASNDGAFIDLFSSTTASPNSARGNLAYQFAGPPVGDVFGMLSWSATGVTRSSVAGLSGAVPLTLTDAFARTVTATGINPITFGYPIPGASTQSPNGDPVTGPGHQATVYRIRASGNGTEASPAVGLAAYLQAFGVNTTLAPNIGPAAAGNSFNWLADISMMVTTVPGPAATADVDGFTMFNDLTTGVTSLAVYKNAAVTVNTTVANNFDLAFGWASITGGPTMTCTRSQFWREGS